MTTMFSDFSDDDLKTAGRLFLTILADFDTTTSELTPGGYLHHFNVSVDTGYVDVREQDQVAIWKRIVEARRRHGLS